MEDTGGGLGLHAGGVTILALGEQSLSPPRASLARPKDLLLLLASLDDTSPNCSNMGGGSLRRSSKTPSQTFHPSPELSSPPTSRSDPPTSEASQLESGSEETGPRPPCAPVTRSRALPLLLFCLGGRGGNDIPGCAISTVSNA